MTQNTVPLSAEGRLLRLDPKTGQLRARVYSVVVAEGPDQGKRVVLPDGAAVRVGSHPDAEVFLTDPTVSRFHLELRARAEGVGLRDLESRNGTFVSGVRISEALLEGEEASVTLGKTTLRIGVSEADVALPGAASSFGKAIGASASMGRLFGLLQRVAPTDSTVVLLGETGTGKEVLAESIHQASARQRKAFVVFDCGAVSSNLVESELFGHVKGAFTGAVADRPGAFLEANGGTLFLDELGELPLELQPKLLRALEAGTVKRVGEDRPRSTDVRIIAATHRDLEAEVAAGRFREDLYFRLAVVLVRVPPLRERHEDIPLLAQHFVQKLGRPEVKLPEALLSRLCAYSWPGNVRELRNVVERALTSGADEALPKERQLKRTTPQDEPLTDLPFKEAKEKLVETFTRDYLSALLEEHAGNVSRAAKAAGLNRNWVQRLAARYGIKSQG